MAAKDTKPRALTDAFVRQCKSPETGRIEIRDTKITGLMLRVSCKGAKTFSLYTRGHDGRKLNLKLGDYPAIGLKVAREIAQTHLQAIAEGKDPREELRKRKANISARSLTLRQLLDEGEEQFGPTKTIWKPAGRRQRRRSEARCAIENVFAKLLDKPISSLTQRDFSNAANSYKPKRPKKGKTTANGAVSRALSYLKPLFAWAGHRGQFEEDGAGRDPQIETPDLKSAHDPSSTDPSIERVRERLLNQAELTEVLPLLTFPAPADLRPILEAGKDYAPVALKFLLLTLSRIEEVCAARKKDIDMQSKTWTKRVKTNLRPGSAGYGQRRKVTVPLSDDAMALICSLPSFLDGGPDDLIFPSSKGAYLGNWERVYGAIHEKSNTSNWASHDLRRTAATILKQGNVAPSVIDALLCHAKPMKSEKVSDSAVSYIFDTPILEHLPDPRREAVNLLATLLRAIRPQALQTHSTSRSAYPAWEIASTRNAPSQNQIQNSRRSPWASK